MARRLEELHTTEDAGRARPRGPACEAAIGWGIDLTMLEHSLALRPFERLREHTEHGRFSAGVRSRALPARVLADLEQRRLDEKLAALGVTRPQVLEPVDGDAD